MTMALTLAVGSSPTSADTTGITLTTVSKTAIEGGDTAEYLVQITGDDAPLTDVTVNYTITGASADVAASPASGFTLGEGNASATITVTAVDDNINEDAQDFTLNLTSTPNVGSPTADGTVSDNDDPPVLSINNVSAKEGNSGDTAFTFTISASRPSERSPQVSWAAANGTATVTQDFDPASGSETFASGQTTKLITVNVNGDTTNEPNETFVVNLSAPVNASIACPSPPCGVGTIENDDAPAPLPTLSVAPVTADEGAGVANVVVTRNGPGGTVTFVLSTGGGSATPGSDFAPLTIERTIPASQAATATATIPITILQDSLDEPDEAFSVSLSDINGAQAGQTTANVTITDDDPLPQVSISGPTTVTEPATGTATLTFSVSVTPQSGRPVSVSYGTSDGTATAGSDFTANVGSLSFAPGEPPKSFTVTVLADTTNEANETFSVGLSGASNGTISGGSVQVTIVDANAPPTLGVSDAVVSESAGSVTLEVTKAGSTAQTVTVDYAGQSGANFPGATLGADFSLAAGTLTFAPGETTKTITVTIVNDTVGEADETFQVVLKNPAPAGVTLAKATANVKIVDNDSAAGGSGNPTVNPPSPPRVNPPSPSPPPLNPIVKKVKLLTARVLWTKLDGKVSGRKRAAIRVTLNQKVSARLLFKQGKRVVRSSPFELRAGNRTVYVLLPKNVKTGRVDFQLLFTTATSQQKVLKTKLLLKA